MRQLLKLLCLSTLAAAVWLFGMEFVLRHPGFGERSLIAVAIALQSSLTLLSSWHKRFGLRTLMTLGGAGISTFGGLVLVRICQSPHFEGFALLIATALVLQGSLTLALSTLKDRQITA